MLILSEQRCITYIKKKTGDILFILNTQGFRGSVHIVKVTLALFKKKNKGLERQSENE